MFRAGLFAKAARITEFLPKKKLIGISLALLGNGQGLGWTVKGAEAATGALFAINEGHPRVLRTGDPQKVPSVQSLFAFQHS
jgi:hypothetical protein